MEQPPPTITTANLHDVRRDGSQFPSRCGLDTLVVKPADKLHGDALGMQASNQIPEVDFAAVIGRVRRLLTKHRHATGARWCDAVR